MKVIIINGSAGVGKDSFCDIIKEKVNAVVLSTIDLPKEIARKYFGWNDNMKSDKDRLMLVNLKDNMTWYDDLIHKDIVRRIEEFNMDTFFDLCFVHCREPNEISKLVKELESKNIKVITLLVTADSRITHVPNNHADMNVKNYKYDYYVDNNSTLDVLKHTADIFLEAIH